VSKNSQMSVILNFADIIYISHKLYERGLSG
jgi:hypothetical protein